MENFGPVAAQRVAALMIQVSKGIDGSALEGAWPNGSLSGNRGGEPCRFVVGEVSIWNHLSALNEWSEMNERRVVNARAECCSQRKKGQSPT